VANLAELVLLAAEQPADRILNCGDPDPPTVRQIERAIAGALSHEWDEVLLSQHGYEVPAVETPWSVPRPFILDMSKAKRELGYEPVVRYEEAVSGDGRLVWWKPRELGTGVQYCPTPPE
jgi:nucleoside-diphosphate-sugar epimerase